MERSARQKASRKENWNDIKKNQLEQQTSIAPHQNQPWPERTDGAFYKADLGLSHKTSLHNCGVNENGPGRLIYLNT